jgi:hypothetical protein
MIIWLDLAKLELWLAGGKLREEKEDRQQKKLK